MSRRGLIVERGGLRKSILPQPQAVAMAHEIAKLLLEHAGTFLERTEAIRTALRLGMPLREIEEYLDWLDRAQSAEDHGREEGPPSSEIHRGEPDDSSRRGDR